MANSFKHYVIIFLLISHIFLILKKIEKSIKLKNNEELNKLEYKRKVIEKKLEIAKLYTELTYEYKYLEKIVKFSNNSFIEKNESSIVNESSIDTNYSSIEKNDSSIVNESSIDTNYSSIDKNEYIERLLDQIPIYDPKTKFVKLSQLEKDKFCKTHYEINALDIRLELLEKYIFGEISREVSINTRINNLLFNVSKIINNTYLQNDKWLQDDSWLENRINNISFINNNNSMDDNLYVVNNLEYLASIPICRGFNNYTKEIDCSIQFQFGIHALKHRLFILAKLFTTIKNEELTSYLNNVYISNSQGYYTSKRDSNIAKLLLPIEDNLYNIYHLNYGRQHLGGNIHDLNYPMNNTIHILEKLKRQIICNY